MKSQKEEKYIMLDILLRRKLSIIKVEKVTLFLLVNFIEKEFRN